VHTVDLLPWLAGPVAEVYGKFGVFSHDIETEDKTVAVLTFANGALGTLTTTTSAYPGLDRTVFIHGSKGSVVAEDDLLIRWRIEGESPEAEKAEEQEMLGRYGRKEQRAASVASDPFAFATRGHLLQFEALATAVRDGVELPNSIETARHPVELMTAIYESGRTGRAVTLGHAEGNG
jgi:predicted dehydrogenase